MMQRRDHIIRSGVTLLELLAVIVLAVLIAGSLAVNLAAVDDSASLREAAGKWQEMDRRARLLARSGQEAVMMEIFHGDLHGRTVITMRLVDSADVVSRLELPAGVTAEVMPETFRSTIVFDRAGRSSDYTVRLLHDGSAGSAWHVHGMTGLVSSPETRP